MLKIDYFILERIVDELKERLIGARLAKVHQPSDDSLVLRLWNGRQNLKLLLHVGSGARLHLTQQEFTNPFHPPRFCQLLRSRLKRLESLDLLPYDPVVSLRFSGSDQQYRLICELIGTRSNLYLLDEENRLVDALFKPLNIGGRLLRCGDLYAPLSAPERLLLSEPLLNPPANLVDAAQFEKWLIKEVAPMSRAQAAVLKTAVEGPNSILPVFSQFKARWMSGDGRLSLFDNLGQKLLVAYLPTTLSTFSMAGDSPSEFLDQCFSPNQSTENDSGERARFRKIITTQISRLKKRQKNIGTQQQKSENFAERRQLGELLLANLHLVKKGMSQVEVTNWSVDPPEQVLVPLQSDLSPQQNAEKFFKRYKKEKRGVDHVARRQQETQDELAWLEALLLSLDEATKSVDLNEVAHELLNAGLIQPEKGAPVGRRKVQGEAPLNQATSPAGQRILWGRNNRSNDRLSARFTDKDDLWFHAHNMPGCHLVLKRDGLQGDFSVEDIEFSARITAGYSRGKADTRVEVMVTEGRYISRPKGAKPGLVRVAEYRTLLVEPLRLPAQEKPDE
ncbi:MAG: NFACT family protein [Geopsychrobacter sp.]|nr:NFACT family protein [Geopsychrobacter sp.]